MTAGQRQPTSKSPPRSVVAFLIIHVRLSAWGNADHCGESETSLAQLGSLTAVLQVLYWPLDDSVRQHAHALRLVGASSTSSVDVLLENVQGT